jgi:hypothetical protein
MAANFGLYLPKRNEFATTETELCHRACRRGLLWYFPETQEYINFQAFKKLLIAAYDFD